MKIKAILYIIMSLAVLVGCDDAFDEDDYATLPLETTLTDKWHTTIGYINSGGTVKDKRLDRVGDVYSDGKVYDRNYDRAGTITKQTETRYKVEDNHYNIVGYVDISDGTVKNRINDVVGYGSGENVWKAGVILLLFNESF